MNERGWEWLGMMGLLVGWGFFIRWRADLKNGLLGWPIYPRNVQPPTEQVERLKQ